MLQLIFNAQEGFIHEMFLKHGTFHAGKVSCMDLFMHKEFHAWTFPCTKSFMHEKLHA